MSGGACLGASRECLGTLPLLRVVDLGIVASTVFVAIVGVFGHPFFRDWIAKSAPVF